MKRKFLNLICFVLGFNLIGCSITINQPVQTPLSATNSPVVSASETVPSETSPSATDLPTSVNWSNLNLNGKLVYTGFSAINDISILGLQTLELTTGETRIVFSCVEDDWIYYATASPDGKQAIISYSPPSATSTSRNPALYVLPLNGSEQPRLLLTPPSTADQYSQVEWSPDGKTIYYVHNNYAEQVQAEIYPHYEIFRMAYPDGEPEKIIDKAFWPRLSPDSSELVYVALDPVTGQNALFVAEADGSNSQQIELRGENIPEIVDAPLFSPDGKTIIFSAPSPTKSYKPNLFDKLMGVLVARAHNVPSDWWSVPVVGGVPTQLTHIQSSRLFASIAPDKNKLVSFSQEGLFVMDLDGSNPTLLIPATGGSTVSWVK